MPLPPSSVPDVDLADLTRQVQLLQTELDACAPAEASLSRAERRIAALQGLVERQSARIVEEQRRAATLAGQIEALRGSLSWRVTAPLRAVRHLIRRADPDRH